MSLASNPKERETLLHVAAENGDLREVKRLLKRGANINALDGSWNETPLIRAVTNGHDNVVAVLLNSKADYTLYSDPRGWTPLHAAIVFERRSTAELLLRRGVPIDIRDANGNSPLHSTDSIEMVEFLLSHGAPLDSRNKLGETPLHEASQWGNAEKVRILLDHGAPVHAAMADGRTPLHCALAPRLPWNELDTIEERTARAVEEALDVVKILLWKGARLDALDSHGDTPLHIAARNGHLSLVELLMKHGADLTIHNAQAESPAQAALKANHKAIGAMLAERMPRPLATASRTPQQRETECLAADDEDIALACLLESATPDLYRNNAFRILNVPVTASSGDSIKQQKRLAMMERLGERPAVRDRQYLPITPPPDEDTIRKASQRHRDPELRLMDELFWIWPRNHGTTQDEAMDLLAAGRIESAVACWTRWQCTEQDACLATHNLAVLHHAVALDMERLADRSPDGEGRRDHYWKAAYQYWRVIVEHDEFWNRVAARARDLDDPRLTDNLVRRMRCTLPLALIHVGLRLAVQAATTGDVANAKRHLDYLRNSGLAASTVARVVEQQMQPFVEHIRTLSTQATDKGRAHPERALGIAQTLRTDAKLAASVLDLILTIDHPLCRSAYDMLSKAVLTCSRVYGEDTAHWTECLALLRSLRLNALSHRLREDITSDIQALVRLSKTGPLRDACSKAREAIVADPQAGHAAASALLGSAPSLIAQLQADGEVDESTVHEWEDEVTGTVLHCAIAFGNQTERWAECLALLQQCMKHVHDPDLRTRLLENLKTVGRNKTYAEMTPIRDAPSLSTTNGIGFGLYGSSDIDPWTESYASTYYFLFFFIPVFPISRYRVIPQPNGYRFLGKLPLRSCDWWHLAISIALIVGLFIAVLVGSAGPTSPQSSSGGRSRSPGATDYQTTYRSPSPSYSGSSSSGRSGGSSTWYTGSNSSSLSDRIDAERPRVSAAESELNQLDSQLTSMSAQIATYKTQVEGYERQVRAGISVNESDYQHALDSHNGLVTRYNALLESRKAKYAAYKAQLDSFNDMVRRYNRGERY